MKMRNNKYQVDKSYFGGTWHWVVYSPYLLGIYSDGGNGFSSRDAAREFAAKRNAALLTIGVVE